MFSAGGSSIKTTGTGLSCVVCTQVGSRGSCSRLTRKTRCLTAATYCKSTVTYYVSSEFDSRGEFVNYQLR